MRRYWMLATSFVIASALAAAAHLTNATLEYLPPLGLQFTIPLGEFAAIKICLQIVINLVLKATFGV